MSKSSIFPVRGDSTAEKIRKTVLIISVITMIVCGLSLVNTYIIEPFRFRQEAKRTSDEVSSAVVAEDVTGETRDLIEVAREQYPDVVFPEGIQPRYASLYAQNTDLCGWLSIPEFDMGFTIVQAGDNDAYLRHNFYRKYTKYGVPFADFRNNMTELDRNTIIYGHNMSYDNLIFGNLERYLTVDGFKKAPVITFNTLYEDYSWKLYAVFITNSEPEDNNGFVFNFLFTEATDEQFEKYIADVDDRKLYSTGVDILPGDKILTLSTCGYDFNNCRIVVIARMVRPGESREVDTSLAKKAESPMYPQKWYDVKGIRNPYIDKK